MASQYDLTIVGGGIIGLATALKIGRAHPGLRLLLLEKKPSSRAIRPATIAASFIRDCTIAPVH